MKKLITLLFAGLSAISLQAQELPENLGIPEKYENYKELPQLPHRNFYFGDKLVHEHSYDIDEDGIADVGELYPVTGFNELGQTNITKYPLFYAFEMEEKEKFSLWEMLYDKEMDGLNGNEIWMEEKKILNGAI